MLHIESILYNQLSWVRRRDWQILTHGLVTFTSDSRFQLVKEEGSNDWVLQIKYVVARDTGIYECQVGIEFSLSKFPSVYLRARMKVRAHHVPA